MPRTEPTSFRNRPSAGWRFLAQFHDLLTHVLLGAATITALLARWVDTVVILALVIMNARIGCVLEGKAEKATEAMRRMLAPRRGTARWGAPDGEALVPSDLALPEAGDKVPADLCLLRVRGRQVQEGILTGESVAVEKRTDPVAADAARDAAARDGAGPE